MPPIQNKKVNQDFTVHKVASLWHQKPVFQKDMIREAFRINMWQ